MLYYELTEIKYFKEMEGMKSLQVIAEMYLEHIENLKASI